jgi:hypothetical protein
LAGSADEAGLKCLGASIRLIAQYLLSAVPLESSGLFSPMIAFAISRFCDRLEGAA